MSRHATVVASRLFPFESTRFEASLATCQATLFGSAQAGFELSSHSGCAGAVQRPFLGRVVDGHVEVEEAPEVDGCRKQQQQDRQDERELDDALAAATIAATDHGTQGHRWTYSSCPRRP